MMDPMLIIDSYVDDVARRLPRRQRGDVGAELRALLLEELQGRADEAGRPADETMALDLLRGFGRPEAVAERYAPPSFTIVEPAQTRTFLTLAVGGVAVQWAISLAAVMSGSGATGAAQTADEALARLGGWWLAAGVPALWWPGLMVLIAAVAAWMRHRWPDRAAWSPRVVDRDRINRAAWTAAMAWFMAGAGLLVALPWLTTQAFEGHARQIAHQVAGYDPAFQQGRGPWILPVWAAQFMLLGMLIAEGRWRPLTRRINIALNLVICAVMAWWLLAGRIMSGEPAEGFVRLALVILVLVTLGDAIFHVVRDRRRVRWPQALARPPGV